MKTARKSHSIKSVDDKSIKTGLFLIDLLYSVEPSAVDYALVTSGETEEEQMINAKYALSIAYKIGCKVYLVWEYVMQRDVP